MRGIFFDEEAAAAVEARLTAEGYAVHVTRERLAGEDDDEDHPWAVVTDAPEIVLELLVDQFDGWLDPGGDPSGDPSIPDSSAPPLPLPTEPRRIKRPGGTH